MRNEEVRVKMAMVKRKKRGRERRDVVMRDDKMRRGETSVEKRRNEKKEEAWEGRGDEAGGSKSKTGVEKRRYE